tara:strand:- start:271 stop:897 length:627 start_codon:yes stop_codon:yes gene_type:complete
MDLNLIALKNIKVLANFKDDTHFLNCDDKIVLESKLKDDKFENITELSEIEYVLYFSFHQLINIPIREVIDDYSRKELLNIMIDAIATVYYVYDNSIYDTENRRICQMMNDIDEIVFKAKINYKKNKCYYQMLDMFDYLCTGFTAFHELSIDFNSQFSGIIYENDDIDDIDIDDIDSPSDDSPSDSPSDSSSDLESDDESDNKRRKLE